MSIHRIRNLQFEWPGDLLFLAFIGIGVSVIIAFAYQLVIIKSIHGFLPWLVAGVFGLGFSGLGWKLLLVVAKTRQCPQCGVSTDRQPSAAGAKCFYKCPKCGLVIETGIVDTRTRGDSSLGGQVLRQTDDRTNER